MPETMATILSSSSSIISEEADQDQNEDEDEGTITSGYSLIIQRTDHVTTFGIVRK